MYFRDEDRPCLQLKRLTWDRFIRSSSPLRRRFDKIVIDPATEVEQWDNIVNRALYSSSKEMYQKLLAEALSVSIETKPWYPQWPVHHRANPIIKSAYAVLDLPYARNNFCSSLMDWSSLDYLTVAFPRSVHLWYAPKNRTVRFNIAHTTCLKWTRDGKTLFTASKRGNFKLTNVEFLNNSFAASERSRCHCSCFVTCCCFHPCGDLLITGCSEGSFSMYTTEKGKSITLLYTSQQFQQSITAVEFSCDGKHFAVSSMSGLVGVYVIANPRALFFIRMSGLTRALSWHPWDRSCLVVADCLGNMNLYNVLQPQELKASYESIYDHSIVCLTFNPVSGELVVSHRLCGSVDDSEYRETQINVLASFNRVVDRLEGHTGRVLFMNWNPDGTKLATCGSEETARIWNFLPESKKRQSVKKENDSYFTSTVINLGKRLGCVLR